MTGLFVLRRPSSMTWRTTGCTTDVDTLWPDAEKAADDAIVYARELLARADEEVEDG